MCWPGGSGPASEPGQSSAHKGPLSAGGSEPGRSPVCAVEAALAHPEGCALPHMVPVAAERLLFASRGPAWRRSGPVLRGRSVNFRRVSIQRIGGPPHVAWRVLA